MTARAVEADRIAALEAEVRQLRRQLARSEQALARGERLQALGQLTSGVAHELANPLTAVIARAALIASAESMEEARAHAACIEDQGRRATKIVRNLSAFARRRRTERGPVSLNDVVRAVVDVHGHQLASGRIDLREDLASDLPAVEGDAHELERVLLNLVMNAQHAMVRASGAGRLTLRTRAGDGVVRLSVADDGPGIPADLHDQVFEPFFTTKGEEGTGLGLAICRDLVAAHGGRISVESRDGRGTTMVVELPRRAGAAPAVPRATADARAGRPPATRGRLLVVDDEPDIAELVAALLRRRGYQAEHVHSAAAALARVRAEDYHGIVTDVRMPQMNGEEFWQVLRRERPALARRTIFMTGDHADPTVTARLEATAQPHLTKPFGADELDEALSSLT
jgi:nitrogen-specific signal transduction histidine kinase/CheY-like chemotaxis protein